MTAISHKMMMVSETMVLKSYLTHLSAQEDSSAIFNSEFSELDEFKPLNQLIINIKLIMFQELHNIKIKIIN